MTYTPYEILKWWLPIVSALSMAYGAWRSLMSMTSEWVDKLLNNHMHHIEENTTTCTNLLRGVHEEFVQFRTDRVKDFALIHDDMHAHAEMDVKIQQAILTNLEILKDRYSK